MKAPVLYAAAALLTAVPNALPTRVTSSSDYLYKNKIDKVIVPPVGGVYNRPKIVVKVSFSKEITEEATVTLKIRNKKYSDGKLLTTFTTKKKQDTFVFEYGNGFLTYETDYLLVNLTSPLGNDTTNILLRYRDTKELKIKTDKEVVNFAKNVGIYTPNTTISYNEVATFEMNSDVRLGINNGFYFKGMGVKINPIEGYDIEARSLIMRIYDGYEDFKSIGYVFTDFCYLQLEYDRYSSSEMGYKLKDEIYVHPVTHELSKTQKPDFVKTNQLFFPSNSKEGKKYKMVIRMEDFGINDSLVECEFTITLSRKMFGNCIDSDYCITAKDATPDIKIGTQISK